jgi:hypothetical protein
MTRAYRTAVFACAFALSISVAYAKPRHHMPRIQAAESTSCVSDNLGRTTCQGQISRTSEPHRVAVAYDGGTVIGGRPAGCPRAYCGCGAMKYLGLTDKRLWKAWNWTLYYSGPTPVAVWHHHVAIIERMTGPHTAILRDYNSGRGLSRIHERDIRGARIIGHTNYAANQ